MLDKASAELRLPRDRERQRLWLSAWDRSFVRTGEHCAELDDTRRTLGKLRERVEALLQSYARDDVPLTERIERALERIGTSSSAGAARRPLGGASSTLAAHVISRPALRGGLHSHSKDLT